MNAETLTGYVRAALQSLDEGRAVERVGIRAGLELVFGRAVAEEEIDAAITQLRLIPPFMSLEERVELVLESLAGATEEQPFLHEEQQAVAELFDAAERGEPFSLRVRHDFGVLSPWHAACLAEAIRGGRLTRPEALSCLLDGERLTAHLAGFNEMRMPLTFRTTDHNGMPRVTRDLEPVIFQEAVEINTPGRPFRMAIANESELRQVAIPEPETVAWLDGTITPESVLYDVGANVGYYALHAASLYPGVRAVAFEPAPLNVARLNTNIHLNRLGGAVMAFPIALSEVSGVLRFGNSYFVGGGWSHRGIDDRKDIPGETFFSGCVAYSLDDFLKQSGFLPFPTHLKIDVDGPELKVLRGAMATLADPRLQHLLIEMRADDEVLEAERLLGALGWVLVGERGSGLGNRIFVRA
ncbi:MAG: FkbM family methyltransferase [Magnetococcales bacterium]|nr:FkbM family methyltransferase [Magnetococcales bacterium]